MNCRVCNKLKAGTELCKEHRNCKDCGIIKDRGMWYHEEGLQCDKCREVELIKKIEDFQESGQSTEYTNDIVCPHCGDVEQDSWEYQEHDEEHQCGECGEVCRLEVNIDVSYSTQKIE